MGYRMRSIIEVATYFKQRDPDTQMTEATIRHMIKHGSIPFIKTGSKYLINLDSLLSMLGINEDETSKKFNLT